MPIHKETYLGEEAVGGGVYTIVDDPTKFSSFIKEAKLQKYIVFDSETDGLNWVVNKACGFSIGWGIENNYYLPIRHEGGEKNLSIDEIRQPLQELFGNKDTIYVGHHSKFDLHMLKNEGIEVAGVVHDTLIMSKILNENGSHGLKDLANKHINPHCDKWDKIIGVWRSEESKRRRKEFRNLLAITETMRVRKACTDKLFISKNELAFLKEKALNEAKEECNRSILAKNKIDDVTYNYIPLEYMNPYACSDVHYTYLLYKKFVFKITEDEGLKSIYFNETRLNRILFDTERFGVYTDRPYLEDIQVSLGLELEQKKKEVFKIFGKEFNLSSSQQLVDVLLEKKVPLKKLTKKSKIARDDGETEDLQYAMDKEVLEDLAKRFPYARLILDYRKAEKNKGTYVDGLLHYLDDKDFIHTNYNAQVSTGRMSSSGSVNLQNIAARDKTVRKAFIVPDNDTTLVYIDYSQIELRITAHYSQDPIMMSCYPLVGKGQDVHSITAAEVVMEMALPDFMSMKGDYTGHKDKNDSCGCPACVYDLARFTAKRVNFGIIYGVGPEGLQKQLPTYKTERQCKVYIENYLSHYRGVAKWLKSVKDMLRTDEYITDLFGRRRRFPGYNRMDYKERARAERQAGNALIQSSAADLFKTTVVKVDKYLQGSENKMTNFVHDEIQFYWKTEQLDKIREVKAIMEDYSLTVPIIAEVSTSTTSWADKKEWK